MHRGDVFRTRSYAHAAFGGLADPVLNIDRFEMSGPTFPVHPHAGFSAVTWLFSDSPNGFLNRDSSGNEIRIAPGEVHWSRASGGLLHEETPLAGGGTAAGLQVFVNLRAERQLDAPDAFHVDAASASVDDGGTTMRTPVNGRAVGGVDEALPDPVRLSEIVLRPSSHVSIELPEAWGGLVIALEGRVRVNGQENLEAPDAIGFATDAQAPLEIVSSDIAARVALVAGARLEQPIHERGPFKLASETALAERIRAFERGDRPMC